MQAAGLFWKSGVWSNEFTKMIWILSLLLTCTTREQLTAFYLLGRPRMFGWREMGTVVWENLKSTLVLYKSPAPLFHSSLMPLTLNRNCMPTSIQAHRERMKLTARLEVRGYRRPSPRPTSPAMLKTMPWVSLGQFPTCVTPHAGRQRAVRHSLLPIRN